jgi:crotonobetainyl-CoA:carnitine CoA-transferase CaiB-like acyl-CoA transferase
VDERPDEASAGRGGPLAGIRVIELGRYISAPFAGRLLGDLGADVIKVEAPDGDPMRWLPVGDRQSSPQFASYNRNKRSITLDLKQPAALSMLGALVASADVLLHNLRPDALSRAGLDEQALSREHPRLVICGISGYGLVGEYAGAQGYDVVVSGLSGLFSQFPDRPDHRVVRGAVGARGLGASRAVGGGAGGRGHDAGRGDERHQRRRGHPRRNRACPGP